MTAEEAITTHEPMPQDFFKDRMCVQVQARCTPQCFTSMTSVQGAATFQVPPGVEGLKS